MRSVLLVVLATVAPALAGCIASTDPGQPPPSGLPDPIHVLPYLDTSDAHDHAAFAQHDAAWNLDTIGWSLLSEGSSRPGAYNHVAVHGRYAYVSAYALPPAYRPGLAVVDLADPTTPTVVGTYTSEYTTPIDVSVSEDGRFAAIGGHRRTLPAGPPAQPPSLCTTVPVPGRPMNVCPPYVPAGVQLLDVSDPTGPTLAAWWTSFPSGAHTVKLATIGGELYAFMASYGFAYADRLNTAVEIARYDPSAPTGFTLVSRFGPEPRPGGGSTFVHDMYVAEHPATGQWLLYVAYWDGGVVIADVDDPPEPTQLSSWSDFDAETYGNIHFVKPMAGLVDGRHYTVAAPEFGSAEHSGQTYVLDTTDPAQPTLLATWHLPGDPLTPEGYMHSPHNFDLTPEGLMAIGHYHAGVWVLDLRPVFAGGEHPTVVGYRFTVPPADAGIEPAGYAPDVWNAVFADGHIVASDMGTGLYVLHLGSDAPGAPPYAESVPEEDHDAPG